MLVFHPTSVWLSFGNCSKVLFCLAISPKSSLVISSPKFYIYLEMRVPLTLRRHGMEPSTPYWLFVGWNPPVDSPHKRASSTGFYVLFNTSLNKLLNKQSRFRWFGTPWRSWEVTQMGMGGNPESVCEIGWYNNNCKNTTMLPVWMILVMYFTYKDKMHETTWIITNIFQTNIDVTCFDNLGNEYTEMYKYMDISVISYNINR